MKGLVSKAIQQVYRDYRIRQGRRGVQQKFKAQMKIWIGEMQLDYLYEKYDGQIMPVQQSSLDKTPQFAEITPAEPTVNQRTIRIKTQPGQQQQINFKKALNRPLVHRNPFKLKTGQQTPTNKKDRAPSNPPIRQPALKNYASPPLPKTNHPKKPMQKRPKSLESGNYGQLYPARSHFEARCGKIVSDVSAEKVRMRNHK